MNHATNATSETRKYETTEVDFERVTKELKQQAKQASPGFFRKA